MCAQMLMHVIAHGVCTDTVRESALKADTGRIENPLLHRGTRVSIAPGFSVGRSLPTELSPPRFCCCCCFFPNAGGIFTEEFCLGYSAVADPVGAPQTRQGKKSRTIEKTKGHFKKKVKK